MDKSVNTVGLMIIVRCGSSGSSGGGGDDGGRTAAERYVVVVADVAYDGAVAACEPRGDRHRLEGGGAPSSEASDLDSDPEGGMSLWTAIPGSSSLPPAGAVGIHKERNRG